MKTSVRFCAHPEHNSLNIYRSEKYFEETLCCSVMLCVGQCSLLHSQHNYWYRYNHRSHVLHVIA
jgi:hypothetical protein